MRARRTGAALLLLAVTSVLGTAQLAAAASPSELLEQGIYSEETKGDVDAALKLYQQVVTEAKAGQAVAAQAQYRLGVCFYKKKNYGEANAAFEKLLKDYPDQKDLIALANKYLASAMPLMPAPWVDGEEQRDLLEIGMFKEKPDRDFAAEYLAVDGLPENTYLTVFGLYILPSGLFAELEREARESEEDGREAQLTDALEQLRRRERFLGLVIDGEKIDIGLPEGYLSGLMKFAGRE